MSQRQLVRLPQHTTVTDSYYFSGDVIGGDLILTKTLQEAEKISKVFTESLTKENEVISESLDSLRPLIALKKHRSRIKCMKLAWDALEDCARQNQT